MVEIEVCIFSFIPGWLLVFRSHPSRISDALKNLNVITFIQRYSNQISLTLKDIVKQPREFLPDNTFQDKEVSEHMPK